MSGREECGPGPALSLSLSLSLLFSVFILYPLSFTHLAAYLLYSSVYLPRTVRPSQLPSLLHNEGKRDNV